ncbi:MAG: ABC transporter ATP-binding protein [Bradymonadales bacterium]|nr:MAG: ABC transporter ATP-binding protein [Bradymonadales bacterium]
MDSVSVVYSKGRSEEKTAVKSLSLQIPEGEIFGLLGPNGAGKTSLISVIVGLLKPSEGQCRVFGHLAGSVEARRLIGFVPQELIHHGFFTVEEILHYISGYHGLGQNKSRIDFLLKKLALDEVRNRKVNSLSGGMKRRLLICKALVHSPKLLLLDEPSAGVDVELRSQLWQFVQELHDSGTTILLTTHYLEEAQRLCKRLGIMSHAKLLALDETGHLISSLAERYLVFRLKPDFPEENLRRRGVAGLSELKTRGEWQLKIEEGANLNQSLDAVGISWDSFSDFRIETGSLEEAFLKIVGGKN